MSLADVPASSATPKPAANPSRPLLWKEGHFVEDPFHTVTDDAPLPGATPVIVSLTRWRKERADLLDRNTPVGVAIQPGEKWADIVPDLPRLAVVAVAIPKYADGRAFSIGRLLRQRDSYAGELRAIGIFIIDQVPYLRRVGFDAFEVRDPTLKHQLETGTWPEIKAYLQPIDASHEVPAGTRPWARRPNSESES